MSKPSQRRCSGGTSQPRSGEGDAQRDEEEPGNKAQPGDDAGRNGPRRNRAFRPAGLEVVGCKPGSADDSPREWIGWLQLSGLSDGERWPHG